jgi:hypothetical protein
MEDTELTKKYQQELMMREEFEENISNINNNKDMSVSQMEVLKNKINKLTLLEQYQLYNIICRNGFENILSIQISTTLFDLEQLDNKTLWDIDYFVEQCLYEHNKKLETYKNEKKHCDTLNKLEADIAVQAEKVKNQIK